MKPLAPPFLFAYGGKVRPVVADTTHRADLVLWRKYPVLPHVQEVIMRIENGEFQASNDARFKGENRAPSRDGLLGHRKGKSCCPTPYALTVTGASINLRKARTATSPTSVFMKEEVTSPLKAKSSARTAIGKGTRRVRRTKCSTTTCLRFSMRRSLPGHG